jgi:hypothetical protein
MSIQIEAIRSHSSKLLKLEQQMTELLALRRAVCLLNAKRSRPKGSRRRIHPASDISATQWASRVPSPAKKWTDVSPLWR